MSPAPRRHPTPISIASNTLLRNMPDATYKESPISNSNSSGNHQCEMGDPAAVAELSLAKWKLRKRWLTVCSAEDVEINQFNRIEEEVDDYIRKARVHDGISGSRRQSFLQPKATGTEEDPSLLPLSRPTDPHQEVSATSTRTNNNGDVTKSVDEEGISLLDVHETVDEAFLERKFPLMSLVNADSERLALPIRLTGVSGMSDEDTVGVERHTSHCPDQDIYAEEDVARGSLGSVLEPRTQKSFSTKPTESLTELEAKLQECRKMELDWAQREKGLQTELVQLRKERDRQAKEMNRKETTILALSDELRQLKREKILWEKNRKAAAILPTKREREEIEALRQENQELRKKIRELEQDGSTTAERCRDRVEMLKRRVMELEEEVRILEGERMAAKESELRVVACPPTAVKKHVRGPSGGHEPLTPEQHKQAKTFLDLVSQTEGLGPYIRELRVDEKLVRWYQSGTSLSWSRNGQVRQKCPDGRFKIFYENGDYREFSQGRTVYWYADRRIIHTTSEDHLHTLEYLDSGQVERYYPDGTHEVAFADGTMKFTFPNGREECVFPDGTVQRVDEYGCRTIAYVDGSKEIFFDNEKKTVFPDGTIKAAKRASYNSAAQIMESSILADSKRASTR